MLLRFKHLRLWIAVSLALSKCVSYLYMLHLSCSLSHTHSQSVTFERFISHYSKLSPPNVMHRTQQYWIAAKFLFKFFLQILKGKTSFASYLLGFTQRSRMHGCKGCVLKPINVLKGFESPVSYFCDIRDGHWTTTQWLWGPKCNKICLAWSNKQQMKHCTRKCLITQLTCIRHLEIFCDICTRSLFFLGTNISMLQGIDEY